MSTPKQSHPPTQSLPDLEEERQSATEEADHLQDPPGSTSLQQLKVKQKAVRRRITLMCQHINEMVTRRDSRRGTQAILSRASKLIAEGESLDEQLSALLTEQTEIDRQISSHLWYVKVIRDYS